MGQDGKKITKMTIAICFIHLHKHDPMSDIGQSPMTTISSQFFFSHNKNSDSFFPENPRFPPPRILSMAVCVCGPVLFTKWNL